VSSIIREPIRGEAATCPVSRDLELWLSSPRVAVANLLHGAFLAPGGIGAQGIVNLPGITVTVAEMIESLGRIAGRQASARISFREDPAASRIVSSWPARFDVARALSLGFRGDAGFDDLVRGFLDDEAAAASR
jgi:nucleoside-diphosphate-sugar epimerase